jgi:hypothetical protein
MGPFVTIFDLIFVLVFLATLGSLLTAGILAASGRTKSALGIMRACSIGLGVYFTALIAVSFVQPQRVLQVGDVRCFDDWCISVEHVERTVENGNARYGVALRLISEAKRVSQRAPDAAVYLTDDQGRRYDPLPDPAQIPLGVLLHPGESLPTSRSFTLPEDAHQIGLIVNHGTGPANFIIGDEASIFHKRTIVKFP